MRNLLMKNMFGDGDDDLEELDWEQGRSSFAVTDLCNQITVSNTLWPTMNVMMMMWFTIYAIFTDLPSSLQGSSFPQQQL